MLAIFWTAYVPFVIVVLSLIGSFIMHRVCRLFARQRFTESRTQQTFAAAEVLQRKLRRGSPTER
jgi:Flp pilus assembly protein TadB